ncbi:hypothetical protein GH714_037208 [Hevea brasiliensis]|uniref:tryptophan synthase n=1 Tax=Hevea brasiliensis TaxID=3981 RepID=A0A6A6LVV8_HEVBR|nr:hypothetical protein GH714_037208 [Hevea brasiliensis]
MNNAIDQAMIAKRMGLKSVVAATGAGQHGVATAAACVKLSLESTVFMGTSDMEKQSLNVLMMKLFGAEVKGVEGNFKDASSQAIREWSVIGKETRRQAMEKWGGKPDVLLACVGSGSNALGIFHEFVGDEDVRLIGVEAAGFGLDSGKHAATLARGEDEEGQIIEPHSIGVSPKLSFLKDTGRVEFYSATDEEAVEAYKRLRRIEGIIPSLEASHALAFLEKLCSTLPSGTKVIVHCSGRGDKDAATVLNYQQYSM